VALADRCEDRIERGTELRIAVANQMSESVPDALHVAGEASGHLNHPVRSRMIGNAE
jgi:hypothetical protein